MSKDYQMELFWFASMQPSAIDLRNFFHLSPFYCALPVPWGADKIGRARPRGLFLVQFLHGAAIKRAGFAKPDIMHDGWNNVCFHSCRVSSPGEALWGRKSLSSFENLRCFRGVLRKTTLAE